MNIILLRRSRRQWEHLRASQSGYLRWHSAFKSGTKACISTKFGPYSSNFFNQTPLCEKYISYRAVTRIQNAFGKYLGCALNISRSTLTILTKICIPIVFKIRVKAKWGKNLMLLYQIQSSYNFDKHYYVLLLNLCNKRNAQGSIVLIIIMYLLFSQ